MLITEDSDRCFVIKDGKAIAISETPEGLDNGGRDDVYAYVVDDEEETYARMFEADSDDHAITKAKLSMYENGNHRAYVGKFLGKTEAGPIFRDMNLIYADMDEGVNEELKESTSRRLVRQSVRYGTQFITANEQERQNLMGAITLLNQAQSANEDSQAKKLLTLSRRVAKGSIDEKSLRKITGESKEE